MLLQKRQARIEAKQRKMQEEAVEQGGRSRELFPEDEHVEMVTNVPASVRPLP